MSIEKVDTKSKDKILLGLITSSDFLSRYYELFNSEPIFNEPGSKWIEYQCLNYYNKYKKAPEASMVSLYESSIESKSIDEAELSYIESLLCKLSSMDEDVDVDYLIDSAIVEANIRKVTELSKQISSGDKSNLSKMLESIENFKKIESGEKIPVISIYDSETVSEKIYEEQEQSLISIPGDLGKELNPLIRPKATVYVRGPSKGLKSYCCFDIALNAFLNKESVAIFELGDLSEGDSLSRLVTTMSSRPVRMPFQPFYSHSESDCLLNQYNECMSVNRTCNCSMLNSDGSINSEYKACTYCGQADKPFPITSLVRQKQTKEVLDKDKTRRFLQFIGERYQNPLDIYTYSISSCTVSNIREICERKANEGNPYSLIVVDHFGLLAPEVSDKKAAYWQVADTQSKLLRKISLDLGCAVVIADQTNIRIDTDEDGMQTASAFTASQSKNQDATAIVTLNRSKEDIEKQTIRVATVMSRTGSLTALNGGYVQVHPNITEGLFCESSTYVSPKSITKIREAIEKLGLNAKKVVKKFRK